VVAILTALLLIAWAGFAPQPRLAAATQLVVERTELSEPFKPGEPPRGLTITLFNPGPKTIHGWTVHSMATFADGYTSNGGHQADSYAYPVRADERSGPIVADARRVLHSGYSIRTGTTQVPVAFGARVGAVIFEDDTAVGDEKDIQTLFERRASNQRAWPVVEQLVDAAVAAGGDPRSVLIRILTDLEALATDQAPFIDAFRWPKSTIASNLKFTQNPAGLLETVVTGVREKRRATDAHYRRKSAVE
jgi:hypothetical protein